MLLSPQHAVIAAKLRFATLYSARTGAAAAVTVDPRNTPLLREGITPSPTESSRRTSNDDPIAEREVDVDSMFERMKKCLHYGPTALIHVDPRTNSGRDIGCVFILHQAPST